MSRNLDQQFNEWPSCFFFAARPHALRSGVPMGAPMGFPLFEQPNVMDPHSEGNSTE